MKKAFWLIAAVMVGLPSITQAATATSVSQWGITWTFSQAREVGQFVNGDWWVQSPVTITSVTPAWDGTKNGTMVDPVPSTQQGYRQGLDLTYNDALRAVFPLTLSGRRSVISTIGLAQVNTGGSHEGLQTAAILTVVDTIVPATAFRPAYINCAKKFYTTGQIRYDLLPTLALPASAVIPSTTEMQRVWLDHAAIRGQAGATIHPIDNMQPYYFGVPAATQGLLCFLDVPERNTCLIRFLQWGLDLYPMSLVNSDVWIAYGGFGRSRKWPILFAGLMFDDENMKHPPDTTFFNNNPAAPVSKFSEDGHTFYGAPTIDYPGGKPFWGQDCIAIGAAHYATYCAGDTENVNASGNKDCRDPAGAHDNCSGYLEINSTTYAGEALAARLMMARSLWGWDAFFDYTDRYVARTDRDQNTRYGNLFIYYMWTQYRNADIWPPLAPTGLSGTPVTDHEITLRWTRSTQAADNDTAAYYIIKRNNVQVGMAFSAVFTDRHLAASTPYAYAVYAADDAGNVSSAAATGNFSTLADNAGPLLDTVFSADQTTVVVVFNEAVGQTSAENNVNYSIPGVTDRVKTHHYPPWRNRDMFLSCDPLLFLSDSTPQHLVQHACSSHTCTL